MPTYSYVDYARLMLALPGTSEQIAQRIGSGQRNVAYIMSSFWRLELCHPGSVGKGKVHGGKTAVWMLGAGQMATGLRVRKIGRSKAQHIAFAAIWRALEEAATAKHIARECGTALRSVYKVTETLKQAGMAHISTWDKDDLGRPVAVWVIGHGKDAERPPAKGPTQKYREYKARLRFKALTMLGACA